MRNWFAITAISMFSCSCATTPRVPPKLYQTPENKPLAVIEKTDMSESFASSIYKQSREYKFYAFDQDCENENRNLGLLFYNKSTKYFPGNQIGIEADRPLVVSYVYTELSGTPNNPYKACAKTIEVTFEPGKKYTIFSSHSLEGKAFFSSGQLVCKIEIRDDQTREFLPQTESRCMTRKTKK